MSEPPVIVAGYFPPPFIGQGVATERLASLIEAARPVVRVSLQNARGLGLDPDTPPSVGAGLSYLRARPDWRRALRAYPDSTVLWTSLSPQIHGHVRDALLVLPAFLPGQRVLGVAHWGRFHRLGEHRWLQASVRRLVRRLDGMVFLDAGLAERSGGFVPEAKRLIAPNTVGEDVIATAEELATKRARHGAGGPLHVLFLSNMLPVKGHLDVLDATAILHGRGVPVRTTFAGRWTAPGDEGVFARRIAAHGLPEGVVTHLGPVYDRAAVRRLYLDADVFAFPTYYDSEAQPLTLLEAFACGTPVVTTRQGGIPGMVTDGVEGRLVPPRAPEAVADALATFTDAAAWAQASEAARARFDRQFSPEAVRRTWLALLARRA